MWLTHAKSFLYTHTHIYYDILICLCLCFVYIYVYMHIYLCVCIYIYTHTYTYMSLSIYSVTTVFLKHLNVIKPSITSLIIPIVLWYMTSLSLPTCGLLNWWIIFPTSHILMVLDFEGKCPLCFPLLLSDHSPSIFSKVNNGELHVIGPYHYTPKILFSLLMDHSQLYFSFHLLSILLTLFLY